MITTESTAASTTVAATASTAVSGPPRRLIAALLATAVVCAAAAVLCWNSDRTASPPTAVSVVPEPPTPNAELAVGRIVLDRDTAPVGTRLTVRLTDWPSGAITVRLCGNAAARGSADCANTTAVSSHVRGAAPAAVVLVVAAPPVACPCVVQASDTATAARAAQPFTPTGLPDLPQAPASEPATAAAVEIADARLVDERPWHERWSAWFGGSAHRTLVLTLRNPGTVPAAAPPLSLVVGRGDPPTTLLAAPDVGTLAPGEQRTFHIGVTLGAPAYGTYHVRGQLGDSAASTGVPATSFALRASTTPWGLAAVAGLVLAWLLRPLFRRGRKPFRDTP
ncbi:hypothetical protein [Yinghuangia sp. YIM S09857]|uniref:hypothetical protein n=1 Tax=Yinghuangia sp. YIM S09857 TaxID=3436929 RepID=UPI003F529756